MHQTQRRTAIRMIGHLLEHHGTAHYEARRCDGIPTQYNNRYASCWCLAGATNVVAKAMKLDDVRLFATVGEIIGKPFIQIAEKWDRAYELGTSSAIVQKLKEYK